MKCVSVAVAVVVSCVMIFGVANADALQIGCASRAERDEVMSGEVKTVLAATADHPTTGMVITGRRGDDAAFVLYPKTAICEGVTGKESTVADVKPGVKVIVYFRTLDGALGHVRLIRIFPDELPTIVQEEPMINIDMAAEAQTGVQSAGSETK